MDCLALGEQKHSAGRIMHVDDVEEKRPAEWSGLVAVCIAERFAVYLTSIFSDSN